MYAMNQKTIKSNLAVASEEQREQILAMIDNNLDLLKRVGEEIEQRIKENGGDHMKATSEVLERHQVELEKLMPE